MPEIDQNLLQTLKNKRKGIKAAATRFETFINNVSENNIHQINDRIEKFSCTYEEFNLIQTQIEELDENEYDTKEREDFENRFFELKTRSRQIVANVDAANTVDGTASLTGELNGLARVSVKLPTINLPNFSGNYEDWFPFHDTFNSLIHNDSSLLDIQKFHYLKSCLKGEAANVLHCLEVSSNNYKVAWEMLESRYSNKRLTIQNHIKAICDLPVVLKENHVILRQIIDGINKHTRALDSLKRPVNSSDDLLVYILTTKLDDTTIKEWETSLSNDNLPSMEELLKFLNRKCQTLEAISKSSKNDILRIKRTSAHIVTDSRNSSCTFCKQGHTIYKCPKLTSLSVEQRIREIKAKKLCLNCLKSGHFISSCMSGSCNKCGKKHNTLLHKIQELDDQLQSEPTTSVNTSISNHAFNVETSTQILLSTALVYVLDSNGNKHTCRVLLDTGSQSNLITTSLVDKLSLDKKPTKISIAGINNSVVNVRNLVNVNISSLQTNFKADLECLTLDKISERIPLISLTRECIQIPKNIKLADPEFHVSKNIDMLLGVELFYKLLCVGQIKLGKNQPYLQKTLLGWLVSGRAPMNSSVQATSICNISTLSDLNENIQKFWELENMHNAQIYSSEEMLCEAHFINSTTRGSDGRFIVSLPFRDNNLSLGNSRDLALKRLHSLNRRFSKNPELRADYTKFVNEYLELGHMRRVNNLEEQDSTINYFYLPHHAVIKENSLTTKLRVVFDASAPSATGVSLNDKLMVGPKLQQDLFDIVCRFRIHKYVCTADIAKMYRQVYLKENCRPYHRILWCDSEHSQIQTFELTTVTYGTAPASYLAVRCLQQLAKEESTNHPLGAQIVLRDFYVDDLLTGASNVKELLKIRDEVTSILLKGKFELRKWASNAPEILSNIPGISCDNMILDFNKDNNIATLGLQWNAIADTLQYSFNIFNRKLLTKRTVLSHISKVFDPLGLVSPVIIKAKILMQEIWQLKLNWDESLPLNLQSSWRVYMDQIESIKFIKIQRCVIKVDNPIRFEMHGFCDASEKAYGVCVYIRALNDLNDISCSILCSKSKVAPLKATTLPRLELCGALLLAQLVDRLKNSLCINISKFYYWTDSTIVLSWMERTSKTWKTFVANRVSEIGALSNVEDWHHINSKDNPADLVSRGVSPSELIDNNLWWNGPAFLMQQGSCWPGPEPLEEIKELPETRRVVNIANVSVNTFDLFTKFSNLNRLQRVVAYCLRFKNNILARIKKEHTNIMEGPLKFCELSKSMLCLLKLCQSESFKRDLHELSIHGKVCSSSKLLCLSPFLDDEGIIRVGGRLKNAPISYSQKHQVLLPSRHVLTKLIINNEHIKQFHAGLQLTISSIRAKYWPLSARSIVRSIIRNCITCFKTRPTTVKYLMGNLPLTRVLPARPFQNVGVDYFGPVYLRESSRRKALVAKAYGAVFVCFATKAVHLELVGNLTTNSFIAALKRFTARRGKISNIYSDNGTQFVGANNELRKLMNQLHAQVSKGSISEYLIADDINWHFIPPRAPHFGGLWEAAVKSVKTHLTRVIGKTSLSYEEMYTMLVQIEGILNSRPLTPISSDPKDLAFLTPFHFLTGDTATSIAEPSVEHLKLNTLSRWQYIQQLRAHFWKRWRKEYLHELQARTKWNRMGNCNLTPGLLVIVKEDNIPPGQWLLGRVVEVFYGNDGVVRTASVKTVRGVIQRPAIKLCVLPILDNDEGSC